MHDVYQQSNERFIEEERPRVVQAASSHPNNPNLGLPYPYDSDDNEIDNKETYYTNIKGGPIFRIFSLIEIFVSGLHARKWFDVVFKAPS